MTNIMLFCAAGMSTSLLVQKMQKAAADEGYEEAISAHPVSEVERCGQDADIILLGPQVRFEVERIQKLFPDKHVQAIDMLDYGMMNGKHVIDNVRQALGN
ncbi:MAG: PTS sugar transporter subunit IIB [Olsenella sp.]|nr:PTS sugar transporter subunit IIB [Olsenella sp.]